jgi:regulator of replication initiation timing
LVLTLKKAREKLDQFSRKVLTTTLSTNSISFKGAIEENNNIILTENDNTKEVKSLSDTQNDIQTDLCKTRDDKVQTPSTGGHDTHNADPEKLLALIEQMKLELQTKNRSIDNLKENLSKVETENDKLSQELSSIKSREGSSMSGAVKMNEN